MRTTLDLDEGLMAKARQITKLPTKKAVVEMGLMELINARRRGQFAAAAGTGYGMTLKDFLKSRRDAS